MKYLESQLENYFEWEMKVSLFIVLKFFTVFCNFYQAEREPIEDKRVDVCLYLLPPTGHGIKKIDIESLKRIQA